ncbi:MAG: hypothetical protein ACM3VT_08825, partial [Solirubrobacterales bacterium]
NVAPQEPDWVALGYVPADRAAGPRITQPTRPQTSTSVQSPTTAPTQTPTTDATPAPDQQATQPGGSAVGSEYLSAFTPDKLRTIEGVVTNVSTFQLVGTNAEWVQLQVRTDDGELVTVQLGPRDYVSQQDFYVASNDRITLMGAQATAWRQPIILPITATVSGKSITLRDNAGRPLWNEATATTPAETAPTTQ